MAQSLSPQCYLEPAVAASASSEQRASFSKQKADEFQQKCGKVWESYRECVQKAVKEKGLDTLLQQARDENPLTEPPPPPPPPSKNSSTS